MDRAPELQNAVDKFSESAFGRKQDGKTCVFCGQPLGNFKDELSAKEAEISGICQKCQDETFG